MAPIAQPSVRGLAALVLALALVVLGVAALAARAEAAPRVRAMVVGQRGVLFEPRAVTARAAGPFGMGRRPRAGQRVSWFWCRLSRAGGCQRTLELVGAPRRATAGQTFALRVRAFDD
ncbi:MAG: hypothetical protein M3P39_08820, partial [Actinomycetota bacterium]|nr:hypothetical protein [Actinomycetota bacterium]